MISQKVEKLRQAIKGKKVLILTHNNPDPDAIATGWALSFLLKEKFKIGSVLVYGGLITRAENRTMIRLLNIAIQPLEMVNIHSFRTVALVDTQSGSGNNSLPLSVKPSIVIDHHGLRKSTQDVEFTDVRPNCGIPVFLAVYLLLKVYALLFLSHRPLFDRPPLTILFAVEVIAGVILPLILFLKKEIRTDDRPQLRAAGLVIFGLVLNRFDISIFGMIQKNQKIYYPSLGESLVTLGIISAEVLFFFLIARYFPIFEHHPEAVDYRIPDRFRKIKKPPLPEKAAIGA